MHIAREAFLLFCSKLSVPAKAGQTPSGSGTGHRAENGSKEFLQVSCAVLGMSKIAMVYFALQSETTYYVPLVTKFWDKLLEYVLAVILDAIATSPDPNAAPMPGNLSGFKSAAFANIAGLYMSVFHASKALACDRRSAKIVAKIWAKTTPTDPNAAASAHAMKVLCFILDTNCWQALDCLIQECGNTVDCVADLAKERLTVSLKRPAINYEEVESNVEVILDLSDDEQRSFRSSFLKMKGIGAATDGFIALAKESSPITEKRMLAIEACTSFYYHMLRSEVGIPWIIEAARHGFFGVLARLSKVYTGDEKANLTVGNVRGLLSRFIPCHLVFFSVIGAVATGLDRSAHLL